MKIWVPENTKQQVGGGWSFLRNFKKYAKRAGIAFTDVLAEADAMLVSGVTLVEPSALYEAKRAGVPIVFRVDNVPRKSRNSRSTPHQRMKEYADLADVVVYQSEWAKKYCSPLSGDGTIIYNGTDTDFFFSKEKPKVERWLWAYHSRGNEMKGFWEAHLRFQLHARENPNAEFWFVGNFGSETLTLREANFDFWNGEKFEHINPVAEPEEMADIMRQCTHLVYPAVADACPNLVVEAMLCGLEVVGYPSKELSATEELVQLQKEGYDFSAQRMVEEYRGAFELLKSEKDLVVEN